MNRKCEIPENNPPEGEIRNILNDSEIVAIVGLSDKPERDSYQVAEYLQNEGYEIIPVNPYVDSVLGNRAYPDLSFIEEDVDVVDIFRKPEAIPEIVEEAIEIGADVVWMQEGLVHNESARKAREKGLRVVMSKCMKKESMKLRGNKQK